VKPSDVIAAQIGALPGVTAAPHRFGGTEYRYGRRELGHVHGDRFADLPFPRKVRDELVAAGRARPHHVLPDSGWVTAPIGTEEELENVIALFKLGYDRALAQAERRGSVAGA